MATQRSHTGYSGQMAVLSELLFRNCNAAIPVIDVGMDVFAFRDDGDQVARIQVKAAQGTPYRKSAGYRAQFNLSLKQLRAEDNPLLYYALAVRLNEQWVSFLVISRSRLLQHLEEDQPFGIENRDSGELALKVQYRSLPDHPGQFQVRCGNVHLDAYLNAWELLPPLQRATPG